MSRRFGGLATEEEIDPEGLQAFINTGMPAATPPAAPAAVAASPAQGAGFALPAGWASTYTDVFRTPGSEEVLTYEEKPYAFGTRDEDILRSLGFQGPAIGEIIEGYGEYATPNQFLTPEAQQFLQQGGYQLVSKRGQGGDWFTAVDPTGKPVGKAVFRKDEFDPLWNAVTTALSVAAGNVAGPMAGIVNAARAAEQGDILGAIASAAPGIGALTGSADIARQVGQAAQVGRAIQREDPLGLLASGSALADVKDIGGVPVKDILNYGKVAQAIEQGDIAGGLAALGNVTGTSVIPKELEQPVGIATNLYRASQGDPSALINLARSIGAQAEPAVTDTGDETERLLARYPAPIPDTGDETERLIARYGFAEEPAGANQITSGMSVEDILNAAAIEPTTRDIAPAILGVEEPVTPAGPSNITSVLSPDEILASNEIAPAEQLQNVDLVEAILGPTLAGPNAITSGLDVEDILATPIPQEDLGDLTKPVLDYMEEDRTPVAPAPTPAPAPATAPSPAPAPKPAERDPLSLLALLGLLGGESEAGKDWVFNLKPYEVEELLRATYGTPTRRT